MTLRVKQYPPVNFYNHTADTSRISTLRICVATQTEHERHTTKTVTRHAETNGTNVDAEGRENCRYVRRRWRPAGGATAAGRRDDAARRRLSPTRACWTAFCCAAGCRNGMPATDERRSQYTDARSTEQTGSLERTRNRHRFQVTNAHVTVDDWTYKRMATNHSREIKSTIVNKRMLFEFDCRYFICGYSTEQ